jgi:predicted RNase H-like HicB family nuclease
MAQGEEVTETMAMKHKKYTAGYEHDGAMWYVHLREIDGCHSQGRTIAQARSRIREALSLFDDNAAKAEIVDDIRLPRALLAQLKKYREERERVEELTSHVREAHATLARRLTKDIGVSLSDAGELLGVSKQRVEQVLRQGK